MGFPDSAVSLVVDAAGAGSIRDDKVFIHGNADVGGAGSIYGTALGDKVIALHVTGARGLKDSHIRYDARNMSIRSTALVHFQLFYIDGAFEIAGAGKRNIQPLTRYHPIYKDIARAGRHQAVKRRKRYIGLELGIANRPARIIQADLQDPIHYLRPDAVPPFDIRGADDHRFFITLAEIKVDGVGDFNTVVTFYRPLFGISIMNDGLLGLEAKSEQPKDQYEKRLSHRNKSRQKINPCARCSPSHWRWRPAR